MPNLKRRTNDCPEQEGPPTAAQDAVNVSLILGAFLAVALGASQAASLFSPRRAGDLVTVARLSQEAPREVLQRTAPATEVGGRLLGGAPGQWPAGNLQEGGARATSATMPRGPSSPAEPGARSALALAQVGQAPPGR